MKRKLRLCAALTVPLLGAVACGSSSTAHSAGASSQTSHTVSLGIWGPETGPNSGVFPITQGTVACFKAANEAGGVDGYKFNMNVEDDQYNPALTVGVVRKLVEQDHVVAVVGGLGTAPTLAVKSYLESNKIPDVVPVTGSSKAAGPYTYLAYDDATNLGAFQAKYGVEHLMPGAAGTLGLIYQNDDVGEPFATGVSAYAKTNPSIKLTTQNFQLSTTDFTPQLSKLKAANASVVVMSGTPSEFAPIIKAAATIGFTPKWIATFYAAESQVLLQLPKSETGNLYFSSFVSLPGAPGTEVMTQALQKFYPNTSPSVLTSAGWAACTLFMQAFKRVVGNKLQPTSANLATALNATKNYSDAFVHNITWADTGVPEPHIARPSDILAHWTGTELKAVGPFEAVPKVAGFKGQ